MNHPNQNPHRPLTLVVRHKDDGRWNGDWAVTDRVGEQIGRLIAVGNAADGGHQIIADMAVTGHEVVDWTGKTRLRSRVRFYSGEDVNPVGPLLGKMVEWPQGPVMRIVEDDPTDWLTFV